MKTAVTYLKMATVLGVTLLVVAGCGRKNDLRLPDPNPKEIQRTRKDSDKADQAQGLNPAQNQAQNQTESQGEGEEPRQRKKPDRPFILDPLIQ